MNLVLKRLSFIILLISGLLFSQQVWKKPFEPVKLKQDSTHIYLEDYFFNIKDTGYRVTHIPEGLELRVYNNYEFILYGKQINPVDYLGVSVNFAERVIPIQQNKAINNIEKNPKEFIYLTSISFLKNNKALILKAEKPLKQILAVIDNILISQENIIYNEDEITIKIPDFANKLTKSNLRVFGCDNQRLSNDLWIPLTYGEPINDYNMLQRSDTHSNIVYSILIDRFNNGNFSNDKPSYNSGVLSILNWQGGDLAGITQKIRQNYFEKLGVNTLLLSPVNQNINKELNVERTDYKTTSFLGYYPESFKSLESRFGTEKEFQNLIGMAHAQKMNIISTCIVNKLNNNDLESVSENDLTKVPFELDLKNENTSYAITDSIVSFLNKYKIDGLLYFNAEKDSRFWEKLNSKIKMRVEIPTNRAIFQINEVLNSNLFNKVRKGFFIENERDTNSFADEFYKSLQLNGFHHLNLQNTGGILENRVGEEAQNKFIQEYAFIATTAGIPNIFYGDEVGLKGKKPFDNLRKMQFLDLSLEQEKLKNTIAKLNKIRASRLDLMYGDTQILASEKDYLALARNYLDKTTIVIFNLTNEQKEITFSLPNYAQNKSYFAEFGSDFMIDKDKFIIILPNKEIDILGSQ
ncbi:hypothetical protein KRX57_09995 [Weeksellaceae bacterium TAE3-ERU29]|nr:hypothetical protein [Weeksellaceae bacterium TAE3-ERU29]